MNIRRSAFVFYVDHFGYRVDAGVEGVVPIELLCIQTQVA